MDSIFCEESVDPLSISITSIFLEQRLVLHRSINFSKLLLSLKQGMIIEQDLFEALFIEQSWNDALS